MQFAPITEAQVSRAITREFYRLLDEYLQSDVVIVGGGPSGLIAARDTAAAGLKTLVVENNNYLGGGFWIGGYFMNPLTFRSPAEEILDELQIPYRTVEPGLVVAHGPQACARLVAAACDAGARGLNMTRFEDVVYRRGRVEGVVVNWSPVAALPRQITCVDPIALEARVIIDATGHDARVCRALTRRGLLAMREDCGAIDVENSEAAVVEHTGEVAPGLIVAGMAVSTVYGLPRMGPTFAGMLYSGRKAARLAVAACRKAAAERKAAPAEPAGLLA